MDGSWNYTGLSPPDLLNFAHPAYENRDEDISVTNTTAYGASQSFDREPSISLGGLHSADVSMVFSQTTGSLNAVQDVSGRTLLSPLSFPSFDLTPDAPDADFSSTILTTPTDEGERSRISTYQNAVTMPNTDNADYNTFNQAFYSRHLCDHDKVNAMTNSVPRNDIAFEYELGSPLDFQRIDGALTPHQQITDLCHDSSPGIPVYHDATNAIGFLQNFNCSPQYLEIGYSGAPGTVFANDILELPATDTGPIPAESYSFPTHNQNKNKRRTGIHGVNGNIRVGKKSVKGKTRAGNGVRKYRHSSQEWQQMFSHMNRLKTHEQTNEEIAVVLTVIHGLTTS